jgi:hypothetical protein
MNNYILLILIWLKEMSTVSPRISIHYLYLFQLMHIFNTTLIQYQLLKHLKTTPTCLDH